MAFHFFTNPDSLSSQIEGQEFGKLANSGTIEKYHLQSTFTVTEEDLTRMQRFAVDLGDYQMERSAIVVFCCRAIGDVSAVRYWYGTRKLNYTLPPNI